MKKRSKIIIVAIVAIPLVWIVSNWLGNVISFRQLNNNSEFGYDVLAQLSDEELEDFYVVDGFGMDIIYATEYPDPYLEDDMFDFDAYLMEHPMTYYERSGYPTVMGRYHITGVTTSDPDYHLFSMSSGDTYDEETIHDVMRDYRYRKENVSHSGDFSYYTYVKRRIRIRIVTEDDVIVKITIYVRSIPIPGVVF